MCGILGAVAAESGELVAREAFQRALDQLARRGPDDEGIWSDGVAMLGHRRLSIIDLSQAGHQPMADASGRYQIVFNGEIYNYQSLRAELEREGVRFRSECDTEVLLELFARRGRGALAALRGMFAFAIWDTHERTLFLARDRLGIKPLYVWQADGGLAFASELRALRALPRAPTRVSPEALLGYLTWGSVPTPSTMLEGVRSLAPGSWLSFRAGRTEQGRYWDIPREIRYRRRGEALEALAPVLREAVRLRCIADVPVGAFLSGGIDSSAVVALMRAAGQRDLRTFSIVFPGTDLDEAEFAAEVAQRFETSHVAMAASEQDVLGSLDDFFAAMDQPTLDGVNTYVVSRLAKQSGLTVALSGLGGDEVFGGYATFRRAATLSPWLDYVPQSVRSATGRLVARMHPRLAKLEAFELDASASVQSYAVSRGLFSAGQARSLLRDPAALAAPSAPQLASAEPSSPFHATMELELRRYMHDQLLRDSDVFGMAHALEIRVPLIDHEIVEIVARTEGPLVMEGRHKTLLRDALPARLPDACVDRPKKGFTFPFDRWLRSTWRAPLEQTLRAPSAAVREVLRPEGLCAVLDAYQAGRLHWSRPWALYVLARWLA